MAVSFVLSQHNSIKIAKMLVELIRNVAYHKEIITVELVK